MVKMSSQKTALGYLAKGPEKQLWQGQDQNYGKKNPPAGQQLSPSKFLDIFAQLKYPIENSSSKGKDTDDHKRLRSDGVMGVLVLQQAHDRCKNGKAPCSWVSEN